MPGDYATTDPTITVTDRSGEVLPYSRGIMATSLLAAGVTTEDAYSLASTIQQRLHEGTALHFSAEQLVEHVRATLGDQPGGAAIASRWAAWRAAKRTGRPVVIVLTGAPGAGKSTFATSLAVRLGITRVVTSDAIREVLRTVVPEAVLAELHRSTFEVVEADAVDPFAGFDRQCQAVSAATAAVARRLIAEHRSLIAEGVHLTPGAIGDQLAGHAGDPIVVERLIVIGEDRHRANLRRRHASEPLRGGQRHVAGFETIRSIHNHLEMNALDAGIGLVDADEVTEMTQHIVDEIVQRAHTAGST